MREELTSIFNRIKSNVRGICGIFGVFIIQIVLGSIFASGNILPYFTSYIRYKTNDTWITYTTAIWILQVNKSVMGTFAVVGGCLTRWFHPRLLIFIGCFIQAGSTALTGLVIDSGFVAVLMVFGVLVGIGTGMAYPLCLKYAQMWYPKYNGIITGFVLSGFGIGTFLTNFIQTALINPDDYSPDISYRNSEYFDQEEVLSNVPKSFYISGILYGVTALFGFVFMTDPRSNEPRMSISNDFRNSAATQIQNRGNGNEHSVKIHESITTTTQDSTDRILNCIPIDEKSSGLQKTWKEVFRMKDYWSLLVTVVMHEYALIVVGNYYKTYGETFITDDDFLTLTGSMSALGGTLGRFAWGVMMEYSNYQFCMVMLSTIQGLLIISIPLCVHLPQIFFLFWVSFLLFNVGGIFVLAPTAVARAYGLKNFSINYGIVFCASGLIALLFTEAASLIINITNGNWVYVFLSGGALVLVSDISALFWNVRARNGHII